MEVASCSARFSTVVERGRGRGESVNDSRGSSSVSQEDEMFEARRVTMGELTKWDERVY